MASVIFINCDTEPFIDDIMCYLKQYETRTRNTLGRFLGERILIAETGRNHAPIVRCSAVIDEVIAVYDKDTWEDYLEVTWVPIGSRYDWKDNTKVKWLYHLLDIRPVKPFVPQGKRHGRVWMEYEGSVES